MNPLQGLLQVSGVIGAFVCDGGAGLVARNLPAVFADAMLVEADRVVVRLCRGVDGRGGLQRMAVAFPEAELFVRPFEGARLYVVCEPRTNLAYLELAVHSTVAGMRDRLPQRSRSDRSVTEAKRRIREVVERELGAHAAPALRVLDEAGERRPEIGAACERVERYVHLFISRSKSKEMARVMEALLMEAEG